METKDLSRIMFSILSTKIIQPFKNKEAFRRIAENVEIHIHIMRILSEEIANLRRKIYEICLTILSLTQNLKSQQTHLICSNVFMQL